MAGTGARQEDQIITVALEKQAGIKFIYVPFKGGGDVAVQLVGKHVDSTVNNPIEAVAHWRGGKLRPLCVFDSQRLTYKNKVTEKQAWSDIPTCMESGLDVTYLMLRGVFMAPGVPEGAVRYYVDLFEKCAPLRSGKSSWSRAPSIRRRCPVLPIKPGWPRKSCAICG